jgi:hypothetical protein
VLGTKVGDKNARKRQREKERYASMTTEQRNERNRKRRDRRAQKNKVSDDLNAPIASQAEGISHALSCLNDDIYNLCEDQMKRACMRIDEFVPEDDDENSDQLHRGIWNQNTEGLLVGENNQGYTSHNPY